MTSRNWRFLAIVALAQAPVTAQQWRDPSPHRVRFITVEENVQLEVLDWGGSGRALVLLAGLGNTAHVYDEFAPKLADACHIYGINRRGHGSSSHPQSGYTSARLEEDVRSVLEAVCWADPGLFGS